MSYAMLRTLHGVLALSLATLLALYAASGWMIIHRVGGAGLTEPPISVPTGAVGGASADLARVRAAATASAERAGLAGAQVESAEFANGAWRVKLTRVARSAEVTLTPGVSEARVALRASTLAESLKRLHRVRAEGASGGRLAWGMLVDSLALALLLFSVTGVWLFVRLKTDRRLGLALLGASTLYTLGGIAWLALSR